MGGRWYAPHKSGSTILCAAKADRARRWGGSPHTHSCEAEPAGRVEPSGRGGGGPGKPRAAVRGGMWRGHGGGDGAVLGARSAHCSAEKGLISGVNGPRPSRTVNNFISKREFTYWLQETRKGTTTRAKQKKLKSRKTRRALSSSSAPLAELHHLFRTSRAAPTLTHCPSWRGRRAWRTSGSAGCSPARMGTA